MSHPGQAELENLNKTVKQLFAAISFEAGSEPNMPAIRNLFIGEGLLINYNEEEPQVFGVAAFIEHFHGLFQQGIITSLEDREVHHKTKIYDRVAHRYSFYEARTHPEADPFAVGINSIQFILVGDEWKITSMAWNDDARGDGFFSRTMACVESNQ